MRGENLPNISQAFLDAGTSPRARGKLRLDRCVWGCIRNIPACAGKTSSMTSCLSSSAGTSPRARGKPFLCGYGLTPPRNIPACAGKTSKYRQWPRRGAEHPRVRGENVLALEHAAGHIGTSPRARGKLCPCTEVGRERRNIPACAGKTTSVHHQIRYSPEHPRVRGENLDAAGLLLTTEGTSPRARGKPTKSRF